MPTDSIDTSSISFTALYTGHTWLANDLAAPVFRTTAGSLYYHALTPFEWLGRGVLGDNFRTLLLQRHRIMDHLLEEAIETRGVTQVLEIACGLSPRGCRFVRSYPELNYIETDLPDMAARKKALLDGIDGSVPQVMPINIFASDGELSLDHVLDQFDHSQPIAVITEGLVVYFELDTITEFWRRLSRRLDEFPAGIYLSDDYPMGGGRSRPVQKMIQTAARLLGTAARSPVSIHFEDDAQMRDHLMALNFDEVSVHDPRAYYDVLPIPKSRGNPIVRVIEARSDQGR